MNAFLPFIPENSLTFLVNDPDVSLYLKKIKKVMPSAYWRIGTSSYR